MKYIISSRPNGQFIARPIAADATVRGKAVIIESESEPTQEELAAAFALATAKSAKLKEIHAASLAATSPIFAALPVGVQAQFQPVFSAANTAAANGDLTLAKDIVDTCVVPAELGDIKSGLGTALAPFVEQAASVTAASTVEAVQSI